MKEYRSASQILFGYLPDQTVDLAGRVWRVKEWRTPIRHHVDDAVIRRELMRAAAPWTSAGRDADFAQHLRQGWDLAVQGLDRQNGVSVFSFPELWMCRECHRMYTQLPARCACGRQLFGQLPFVGYHECGAMRAPFIRPCPQHGEVEVVLPGTASAAEILFRCPVCSTELRRGFGFTPCSCGQGNLKYNVHRASPVYTPRTLVVVNPPSPERVRRLNDAGGPLRALEWALDDFAAERFDATRNTAESLLRQLMSGGISEELARQFVQQAAAKGEIAIDAANIGLPDDVHEEAAREAVTVAMALDESRMRLADLVAATEDEPWSGRAVAYRHQYPDALRRAGIRAIDLVEKFPVLTGAFAYTREKSNPGEARLVPFRSRRGYIVYADIAETEALFVRLEPVAVADWLVRRGHALDEWRDERSARLAILRASRIPLAGDSVPNETVGSATLSLVHSLAHRLIRRAAVFSGIDRNALSELLVPHHLGFFVYAAARGDFVLGGLQAVFESELHHLVIDVVDSDRRCGLDPGCLRVGGACMACLHLGEPSCRYFNRFLGRQFLFGGRGFISGLAVDGSSIVIPPGGMS